MIGGIILHGYEETIEIISDIMERYNEMMPDIFRKLNAYEKELLSDRPRHIFSKVDCRNVMKQYKIPMEVSTENRLNIISECLLLLYNWYKSKIIYSVEQEAKKVNTKIDREKVKLFPYSGIYLDLEFYSLKYLGCFLTIIREKKGISLQKYILLGFIEYNREVKMYSIEPFLLEVRDGITIEDAFEQYFKDTMEPCYNVERNIDASIWAVSNLYQIIDTVNLKKELKQTASVKREVVSQTIVSTKEGEFRVSKESKYKYLSNKNGANGSKKGKR